MSRYSNSADFINLKDYQNRLTCEYAVTISKHNKEDFYALRNFVLQIYDTIITKIHILSERNDQDLLSPDTIYAIELTENLSKDDFKEMIEKRNTKDITVELVEFDFNENKLLNRPFKFDINKEEMRRNKKMYELENVEDIYGVNVEITENGMTIEGGLKEIRNAVEYLKKVCPGCIEKEPRRGKKRLRSEESDEENMENENALCFEIDNTKIYIYQGDLSKIETDAVAITVGPNFEHASGASAVILNSAGPEAIQQCIKMNSISSGEVKVINIQKTLPFQYIFLTHALSQPSQFGVVTSPSNIIAKCFETCMNATGTYNISSIAFPLFGCGNGKAPVGNSVTAFLDSLKKYRGNLNEIHLVELNHSNFSAIRSFIKKSSNNECPNLKSCPVPIKGRQAMKHLQNKQNLEYRTTIEKSDLTVVFKQGDILEEKSSAIIYPLIFAFNVSDEFINKVINFMGKYTYSKQKRKLEKMNPFDYEITSLQDSLKLCHFCYPPLSMVFSKTNFESSLKNIIKELDSSRLVTSVSFMPFTEDNFHYEIIQTIIEFLYKLSKVKNITEVTIIHTDENVIKSFNNSLESFLKPQSQEENCPICLDTISIISKLPCKHTFCKPCLDQWLKDKNICPVCKFFLGEMIGNQPPGTMVTFEDQMNSLPGYDNCGVIVIKYDFPSGLQGPQHPNPGIAFSGTRREAYLPNNSEGREVLDLLKKAWDRKLIFTIGQSITTGIDNCVIWNDIHHKTNRYGGPSHFGYPDPTYFNRVKDELRAKGVF